jgi:dolichyl-phosphate beta-glucosyltransferase
LQKTCIVVPCYNEALRLNVAAFLAYALTSADCDFLFCNDGSTDTTALLLEEMRSKAPNRIIIHTMPQNRGKAEAVRAGVLLAAESAGYGYIGFWDADLATPLDEISRLLSVFKEKSSSRLAMCSRIKRMGAVVVRSETRHYLGRVFSTFSSIILKLPVYDTQCGAKIFSSAVVSIFKEPFVSRWLFDVELLARFRNQFGKEEALKRIDEVPVSTWREIAGSKLRFRHMLMVPVELLRISREYNGKKNERKTN